MRGLMLNTKETRKMVSGDFIEATPKKTRQGRGKHTKYAASSRNKAPHGLAREIIILTN